jgi:hydroxyacylglutathione hydrolase
MVLCTHKHADHSGGNELFKKSFQDIEIISTKYEETPAFTKLVGEGDSFKLGNLNIDVIHTPCHTQGHIIFIVTGSSGTPIIFSGIYRLNFK